MGKNHRNALTAFTPLEKAADFSQRSLPYDLNPLLSQIFIKRKSLTGFTLLEVIIVLMIVGIVAAIAVPMYVSAASVQLRTAADMVASDLEYAKSMAISTGKTHSVVFDTVAESYCIKDSAGQVIAHPVRIGTNYVINFAGDNRLNKVDIAITNFAPSNTVKFDNIGAPFDGSGNSMVDGFVQLRCEGNMMKVKIAPVTGYVSIE
ncbi:MAG: prepilin-type N-terminal cleavage/methylation domain-containing protein [Phycisphaerae bacterium]|jgi:type II secretion system protein H